MSDPLPESSLESSPGRRVLHRGRVFALVELTLESEGGARWATDVVEHPGAVAIVVRDGASRLLVVEQERPAVGGATLEVPAGRLEPGEDPADAALRELEEETGLRAARVELLRTIWPAPGFCSEEVHLFEAHDVIPAGEDRLAPDEDEDLLVRWLDPHEILEQQPADAKTLLAALHVLGAPIRQQPTR